MNKHGKENLYSRGVFQSFSDKNVREFVIFSSYYLDTNFDRIWETGCVKFWLATLAIHSFSVLPHLQPTIIFI